MMICAARGREIGINPAEKQIHVHSMIGDIQEVAWAHLDYMILGTISKVKRILK